MTLKQLGYMPRLVDSIVEDYLQLFGAIEIEGAKFCGKTWTSMAHGESITHVDDDATRNMISLDTDISLEGDQPHIIDEWQEVPGIWDAVRRKVDSTGNQCGQFILTGSSTVDWTQVTHSGAGRIARIHMRPMSLYESGESNGSISLSGLFENEFQKHQVEADARSLASLICRGGLPAAVNSDSKKAGALPAQYLKALFAISASKQGLDQYRAQAVAVSLARNVGKSVTYKTLYADAFENETNARECSGGFQQKVEPYLSFFKDQFFIEDLTGWNAPVKSRSRVRLKPRRSFVDPSLPASLLKMTPERLLREVQIFGTLFEELCLRDVRIYASAMDPLLEPNISYYSDADGLEVDIIIELSDGRWGAFEVKLSDSKVEEAEKSLLRLKSKVAANPAARNPEPSFMGVLVGKTQFATQLPSGVYVIPITCLSA